MSSNQNARVKVEIGSVQETLLIALWCRAAENRKERPILVDPKASEVVGRLDYDFGRMERSLKEPIVLISNIGSRNCDTAARGFMAGHPRATMVNIGAGLDTAFHRVDNGLVQWYDLDLPDVIDLRRRIIPETVRSRCIARSVFDTSWFDDIGSASDGLFMLAHGVLAYLGEDDLKKLFSALAARFPGAELVFNSFNAIGRWGGNHLAVKRVGIRNAPLRWAVASAKEVAGWDSRIEVADHWPMFSRVPRDPSWKRSTVTFMNLSDRLGMQAITHLRFR